MMTDRDCRSTLPCRLHIAAGLLLCICWGCGTSEYERRLDSGEQSRQASSKFNKLYAPQELAGTPVSVCLPKVLFTDSPLVEGAPVGGKPVDERRVKPGIVKLPGLKLTYEGSIKDAEGGELPYYCYVGATGGQIGDLCNTLHTELKDKPANEPLGNWTDFQGDSPTGTGNQWKKLRYIGPQEFRYKDKTGHEKFMPLAGVLEIYLHEEAGQLIVIAWRMPKSIEPNVGLAEWAPLVAGCVSVK